jgi:hypothetical protein
MTRFLLLLFTCSFFLPDKLHCQDYFRLEADFTVKIKKSDGKMNLTRGKVFYDKNYRELIYEISFPRVEKWAVKDTSIFKIRNDSLIERITIPSINEFTVFHLSLNSTLNDFGLKKSIYKIGKVEKKGDLVLSYWRIPELASKVINHVIIAKKNNKLESVVMVGKDSKIISKQFFRDYIKKEAFEFPGQIIQIVYDKEGKENYQVTEFKNIILNNSGSSDSYKIKLPKT